MSISAEPNPSGADHPVPLPPGPVPPAVVPDFPARPFPPGLARQARRSAGRMALARAFALGIVAAGLVAVLVVAGAAPRGSGRSALPTFPEETPTLNPYPVQVEIPRTGVGLGASAWVEMSGWCVGDIAVRGSTGTVDSCRFLPVTGKLDVAVLDPGHYAPDGFTLVVVVVVDRPGAPGELHGRMSDTGGSGDLTVGRAAGLTGVAFLWGFSRGGPISVDVTGPDGALVASCRACGGPGS
ncbi:hypothetical protein GCM10023205_28960 [Yinghuangia aomiensis]|uniref:Uncharacterized protein n=1 Tax=Yinghuangia aomiensis TaxID=676205 RepID=A0ABP9H7R3_9ACTN